METEQQLTLTPQEGLSFPH